MFAKEVLFDKEGAPIKCHICGTDCIEFEQIDIRMMEYTIMEFSMLCPTCDHIAGHWCTGMWDPIYQYGDFE